MIHVWPIEPGRRGAAERGKGRERRDADDHDTAAAKDVGHAAAEREQCRDRDEVPVDDPLRPGRGEVKIALEMRDREGDDRLIDEDHRDGKDHRRQHEVFAGALQG